MLNKRNWEDEECIFKSSLIKYMLHRNPIFYIIIFIVVYFLIKASNEINIMTIFLAMIFSYIMLSFGYVEKKLTITGNRIIISSYKSTSNYDEEQKKVFNYEYDSNYYIEDITSIHETFNRIIINGKIEHKIYINNDYSGYFNKDEKKTLKKVSLIKDYKCHKKLIEEIRDLIEHRYKGLSEKTEVETVQIGYIVKIKDEISRREEFLKVVTPDYALNNTKLSRIRTNYKRFSTRKCFSW